MRTAKKLLTIFLLILSDALIFFLAYVLAYFLRSSILPLLIPALGPLLPFKVLIDRYYLLFAYLIVFAYEGLYTHRFTTWEEIKHLWRGSLIATGLVVIGIYITRSYSVSRTVVVLAFFLSLILLPIARIFLKRWLFRIKLWSKKVLIIGSDKGTETLKKEICQNPNLGYELLVESTLCPQRDPTKARASEADGRRIEAIIVSAQAMPKDKIAEVFRQAEGKIEEFMIVPDIAEIQNVGVEVVQLESSLLMKFRYNLLQPYNLFFKRALELTGAIIATIIFAPFFLLCALVIKLTSPGPVLFKQPRIGKGQKLFILLKFRSMYQDAEERLNSLLNEQKVSREEWNRFRKIKGKDPRVTPFGRFLRRFSLDELPQLFNVLKGEMNLVGPRPYLPDELENIGHFINIITKVEPGMTGLWQVSGRSELSFQERLLLDEYYVKNWSLWMDFVIMLRTFGVVLRGKGAY
uniref:Sugar transferase n=1 Tax=candidate division WOR-3 bacterium TaxID=2052148 RepID=A0A7C6EAN4_UNCW3